MSSCLNKDIETFDREREFIENEMFVNIYAAFPWKHQRRK